MAYSVTGLIEATDYNNFLNGSNQLNSVWSTGTGNAGYGQTALSTVSAASTVTAAQWASLINTLNSTLTHQSGSGSGISATTVGGTINYLSTLSTNIDTSYTNRLNKATNGTTLTGTVYTPGFSQANSTSAYQGTFTRTIAFASGDAARYFFNAGGYINFITTSAVNNDATSRSADMVTLIGTNLGNFTGFGAAGNSGRSGTGGTLTTNATGTGYYGLTASEVSLSYINATSVTYSGDWVALNYWTSAQNASGNGDKGSTIYIKGYFNSGAQSTYAAPPSNVVGTGTRTVNTTTEDSVNVTWNHRIDVVYPESTNLTSTWGTVTVT